MNIGSIDDFDDVAVVFSAVRAKSTQVVWYDKEALTKASGDGWSQERFLDEFSLVTAETPLFSNLTLDREQARLLKAERYGGVGIGDNGGGSRGGTIGQFQVKGVGVNQLLGRGSDKFHSYGGLGLREGVAELVSSIVFGRVLPHGTVPCYGLIYTARDAAYSYPPLTDGSFRTCPGALLVRATCMRPAHFLRNVLFEPTLRGVGSDISRVRRVNKALFRKFPQRNDFIRTLGKFLATCADQFGFAQAFRLRHGALSPSNLSFDGRWLDVAYIAFIDSGKNYAAIPSAIPSQEEPMAILSILQEFIYTFEKYNRTSFDARPLVNYYLEQLNAYIVHYYARLVGLPPGAFDSFAKEDSQGAIKQLSTALSKCVAGDRTLSLGGPMAFNDRDPIVLLIEDLYMHLQPGSKPRLANGNFQALQVVPAFIQLIEESYRKRSNAAISSKSFRIGCAVRSLRKLYFSSIYYFGSMYSLSAEVAELDNPAEGADLIDEFCDVSRWLFDDADSGQDALFKSRHLEIGYISVEEVFFVRRSASGETLRFKRADELLEAVNRFTDDELRVRHFDFRKNLLRMLEVLRCLDRDQM